MGVSSELSRPETDEEFEAMCHSLYKRMWNDTGCVRMGGPGQIQYGIDILGHDGKKTVGVQCKHYNKKSFTLSTITSDIQKVEKASFSIDHLLFATTAPSKSTLVKDIHELNIKRRKSGKFTVSVDFWGEISGHIRIHPEIGREYIPGFPGARILEINNTTNTHLDLYQNDRENSSKFQAAVIDGQKEILARLQRESTPSARGDEADPRVVASLDHVRDLIRDGKTRDAIRFLNILGDPAEFKDQFSRFRWHANHASAMLLEGYSEEAAAEFLEAFDLATDSEKAHANRAYALLLKNSPSAALEACDESLVKFPKNAALWSLKLNARHLLSESKIEKGLPEDLSNTPEILFTRAYIRGKNKDYLGALELLKKCLETDKGSLETKRAYLAEALSWAAENPVTAHHGQLDSNQKKALTNAIEQLEPLEQTLPAIQSDYISTEVTNNVTSTLMLLGNKDRARALAAHSLVRHPLSEGLLRIRLNELDERDDIPGIHSLVDSHMKELQPPVLGILAEISANRGDIAWHNEVMTAAETSGMEANKLLDLRILSIHAKWMSGNKPDSIDEIRTYLKQHPKHILARTILAQMLLRLEQETEAMQEIDKCFTLIKDNTPSLDILQVADLLFESKDFINASVLYSRLVKTPGNDELTYRLLVSLVESDQRCKAQEISNQLPIDIQALPAFRRIEANLAHRMGNWSRMRDLLAMELKQHPNDSGVAVGYISALYQNGEKNTLTNYLASDPHFEYTSPEYEFEFSKYQAKHGLTSQAITRLYRLYRANFTDIQTAKFYLLLLLMSQHIPELDPPASAGPGSVVHLGSSAETKVIAIDIDATKNNNGWPELISADSDLAKKLQGLKPGDKALLDQQIGIQEAEVIKLESLYSFAAQKAHSQVAAAAVPAGPLWSVRVVKEDGELDVDVLLKDAKQRKEYISNTFKNYKQQRFPISTLANLIGSDPVTLLLDWPFKEATLFIGIGTEEERNNATNILHSDTNQYVLDLLTVTELVQRNSFDAALKLLGRPLIPQTAREQLLRQIQLIDNPRPSATLNEQDDHLQLIDTPAIYYETREALLRKILDCIDNHCEVVPTTGPHVITNTHRLLGELLDNATLDALYLCIERDAVLVSDDGALRLLAPEAGILRSMGVQPVLMEACDKGQLSKEVYADAVHDKITAGHDFVCVRADEILTLAKRTPSAISEKVKATLDAFRSPTLDIISGIQATCEFLGQAIQLLQPTIAAEYGKYALEVLQDTRPQYSTVIRHKIAQVFQEGFQQIDRELSPNEKQVFFSLLNSLLAQTSNPFHPKPLISAIHQALQQH